MLETLSLRIFPPPTPREPRHLPAARRARVSVAARLRRWLGPAPAPRLLHERRAGRRCVSC